MTPASPPRNPGYGNGFDRVRTFSAPEDSRTWFHGNNRVPADPAARPRWTR